MSAAGGGRRRGIAAFEQLPDEKRRRILEAAIQEFAEYGFDYASTNRITSSAGIGKGMLFHYFGSKRELFLYSFRFAYEEYNRFFYTAARDLPNELFARAATWQEIKLDYYRRMPMAGRFLSNGFLGSRGELRATLEEIRDRDYAEKIAYFTEGAELAELRSGVSARRAVELVVAASEGIESLLIRRYWSPDEPFPEEGLRREFREYLELIKYGIYR
jgi:AcrR family transcriptional regulator